MRTRIYHAWCPACPDFRVEGLPDIEAARELADGHDEQQHRNAKGKVVHVSHFGWTATWTTNRQTW